MQLQPIIDRIKMNVSLLTVVGGSADIPSADDKLLNIPAAFVLPGADTAGANLLGNGAINQRVTVQFGVLMAVRNVADAQGLASLTDLDGIRKAVKAQLVGWEPETGFEPTLYKGGRIIKLDTDAVVWWLDEFTTAYFERVI